MSIKFEQPRLVNYYSYVDEVEYLFIGKDSQFSLGIKSFNILLIGR